MRLTKWTYYSLLIMMPSLHSQATFADGGFFFNVSATNNTLTISTTIPNHTYSYAGIKLNTPGYSLANAGTECTPANNGYCLFSVSNSGSTNISITGAAGTISLSLCLNGSGPLSCQNYTVSTVLHNVIYIGNSNGDVQYSNNDGNSWTTTPSKPDGSQVDGISVKTNGAIYAGTAHNLQISTNNGASWTATTPPEFSFGIDSLFLANEAVYVSSAPQVLISYDNGNTWNTTAAEPDGSNVWSIFVTSNGTIYTGTENGNVEISTNNGTNWTATPTKPDGSRVSSLFVINNGATIYAGTADGNVEVSTDAGTTWTATNPPDGCVVSGLSITPTTWYAGTGCGEVMLSTDHGNNWVATAAAPSSGVFCLFFKE